MIDTINEIKVLIASHIDLGGIDLNHVGATDPIFGSKGLGLDSLDAIELMVLLQKRYGIAIENVQQSREIFQSLGSLAEYVDENRKK